MKRIYTILVAVLLTASVFAQTPEKMSYQAVIRNSSDQLITNQAIGMQISILQTTITGTAVYVETHNTTTNTNGLVTIEIGNGTVVSGDFATIDWANDVYFIQTEIDPTTAGGTNYTITGTSQLLSVAYALHAKTAESIEGGASLAIGDSYQGGIIFWLDATGQHGLIAARVDQSAGIRWYAGTFGFTQAKGDGLYAGEANTAIIISSQVSIGDDGSNYAAQLCANYHGGGYGDWYLPSKYELNLLYLQKTAVGGGFRNADYWSSTEIINTTAWLRSFGSGAQGGGNKSNANRVRAVRAF